MKFTGKYYKHIIILIVLLALLIPFFSSSTIKTNGYSVENVYSTIKELTSEKYRGRRYGTDENMQAVMYIESQFKSIGLTPIGDKGTYLNNYMEPTKVYQGIPVLEVIDGKGKVIKSYEYGDDFFENGRDFSKTGEIFSSIKRLYVLPGKELEKSDNNNLIAASVISETLEKSKREFYASLKDVGYKAYIGIVKNTVNFRKLSAGIGTRSINKISYDIPNIFVKDRVSEELFKYQDLGYKIHMKTTTDVKSAPVANVMGMIPGKSDEYLLITAHLDHVGESPDGIVYPGALDNASGVSTMLETARYLMSQGKKPRKNIIFIAFNAEEAGALGSRKYALHPLFPLFKTTVVNLDMIGANIDVPLSLMYYSFSDAYDKTIKDPSSKLRYQINILANKTNTKIYENNALSSDHVFFNFLGVAAVTLTDYDTSKIHTPADNIDNIGKENIDRTLKLLMNYISFSTYSSGLFSGNSIVLDEIMNFFKVQYPLLITLSIMLVLCVLYYKTAKKNKGRKIRFPILSIVIIVLLTGIISYLPSKYPYAPNNDINAVKLLVDGIKSIGLNALSYIIYVVLVTPSIALIMIVKLRMNSCKYKGDGKEYNVAYYIAIALIVLFSILYYYTQYSKAIYYPSTPDFARTFVGKLILHSIIGVVSFVVWKFLSFEVYLEEKNYIGIAIFSLIFFTLIYSFYKPILYNKFSLGTNMEVPMSDSITIEGTGM